MKHARIIAFLTALTAISCSHDDDIVQPEVPEVKTTCTTVAISLPTQVVGTATQHKVLTRQGGDVVQADQDVASFRGMDRLHLLCFEALPDSNSQRMGAVLNMPHIPADGLNRPGQSNYRVFADQYVPIGTRWLLFYGKAIDTQAELPLTTNDERFTYGYIKSEGLTEDQYTANKAIRFRGQSIVDGRVPYGGSLTGSLLVQLLNDVLNTRANADSPENLWSTTTSEALKELRDEFVHLHTGSSHLIQYTLGHLHGKLSEVSPYDVGYPLARAIMSTIANACLTTPADGDSIITLDDHYQGFPMDISLPAGTARVICDGVIFRESMSSATGLESQSLSQYTYPVPLCYTTMSPIVVSDDVKSPQYDDANTWGEVVTSVYDSRYQVVTATTQSVAMMNQIDYAVGRLETQVQMTEGPYYDARGREVDVSSGFVLKGLLVGGQHAVGWDFRPVDNDSTFTTAIYDRNYSGTLSVMPGTTVGTNHTLALETPVNQAIYVALELLNLGPDFQGADGLIPHGGTFYLLSEFDPRKSPDYHYGQLDRVFRQDYVTYATMKINHGWADTNNDGKPDADPDHPDADELGLGAATNGVPDMHNPHIYNIGVSVDLKWSEGVIYEPEL